MKREKFFSASVMPMEIANLDEHWQDLWTSLPAVVDYKTLCAALHFKTPKSLSNTLCADPSAPTPVYIGRTAAFARTAIVLWAANRAATAGRRGCKAAV